VYNVYGGMIMKKGFIIGFIIAAFLFGGITYAAEELIVNPNPYPVLINGVETPVEAYNINGFTYLKLADMSKAGLLVKFNETDKRIEIGSTNLEPKPTKEESTVNDTPEKITSTPDGITMIDTYEGKQYIGEAYIDKKVKEKGYAFVQNINTNQWMLIKGNLPDFKFRIDSKESEYTVILDNIPTTATYGYDSVEINYYINTILPLIQ
jgi:hypothetical protein